MHGSSGFPRTDAALVGLPLFLMVAAFLSARIAPQSSEWVVTRLGACNRTLRAGVNLIVPFIESVHSRVSMADQVFSDVKPYMVSRDNVAPYGPRGCFPA